MIVGTTIAAFVVGLIAGFLLVAWKWAVASVPAMEEMVSKRTAILKAKVGLLENESTSRRNTAVSYAGKISDLTAQVESLADDLRKEKAEWRILFDEKIAAQAQVSKEQAENARLRSALIAGEALLIEQRGLVSQLQQTIRDKGVELEERDDESDRIRRAVTRIQAALSTAQSSCSIAFKNKEPSNASKPKSEVSPPYSDVPVVSNEPKTCLPVNECMSQDCPICHPLFSEATP